VPTVSTTPASSGEPLQVPPPPVLPEADDVAGSLVSALPMVGSLGSILLVTTMMGTSGPHRLVAAGLFGLTTLAFVVIQVDRQRTRRRRRIDAARVAYLRHLDDLRRTARAAARAQYDAAWRAHPDPDALPVLLAGSPPPRGPARPEYVGLLVRYGLATQPAALLMRPPPEPAPGSLEQADPFSAEAAERLLAAHHRQPDLPATLDLRRRVRVEICGEEEPARGLARAMLCSALTAHPPDRLSVVLLAAATERAAWDWLKWAPHLRAVGQTWDQIRDAVAAADPAHVLVLVDGVHLPTPEDGAVGRVTVLDLPYRWGELSDPTCLRFELGPAPGKDGRCAARVLAVDGSEGDGQVDVAADQCSVPTAEAVARRLRSRTGADPGAGSAAFSDLLEWGPWRPRAERDRLRVPIGRDDSGAAVYLDLKESAQQGMGPHGLVVGATGSGKSEFLRALVLGLALAHPPEDLNLVLVDFKGGATFAGLADLPHVAAVITNLADDLTLVDRMRDALEGEVIRRQEALRTAGNLVSVREYAEARRARGDLPPMPSLVIVVDEFSELLVAQPEFIDLFSVIGRLGRSLGLHLLLASQRLDEGRLRGLDAHLSYRVGLRTFSAQESRAVLGVPDAYELPPVPGLGFLKAGPAHLVRFVGGYVSGPLDRPDPVGVADAGVAGHAEVPSPEPFTLASINRPAAAVRRAGRSLLEVAVAGLAGRGTPAHRIWLPPLETGEPVEILAAAHPPAGGLDRIAVGTVDRPRQQRHDPLVVDLSGAAGHVAIVGGPRSGKSSLAGTLMTALALGSSPRAAQFYVLDLAGGGLGAALDLPHVAGCARRTEPDLVARIVSTVTGLVDAREAAAGSRAGDDHGEVFVVVDGWGGLRGEFDDLDLALARIAGRGLAVGVHLVVTAGRWSDLRVTLRDLLGTRLELRLGDPLESEVDRRVAAAVPAGRPGRGLNAEGLHFVAARPTDHEVVSRVRARWAEVSGPRLRMLPERIALAALPARAGLRLGIEERDLAPVGLPDTGSPHLVVYGDAGSGKTALLRGLASEVVRVHTPDRAQILLIDPRRTLTGQVPPPYLLDHLTSGARASAVVAEVGGRLKARIDSRDDDPAPGPDVFVLVDDYDLLGAATDSPVAALVPMLGQARDIGLHLFVTRRSSGAARAAYEPVLAALRDLGTATLLLSGSPDEAPLVAGLRPSMGPPGRGRLVTRERGVEVVQVGWTDPAPG
jgi:S-DNA-T family DNA segregation ATPase FtsK/SpoIIIE